MKVYFGGPIITMEDESEKNVEAVVVSEGIIVAVGTIEKIKSQYKEYEWVNLDGKTLLPGFIDPHSHMIPTAQVTQMPDLSPAPIGDVRNIKDIQAKIGNMIDAYQIPAGGIIMARGYDHTLLEDQRELNRHDLDAISKEHVIYILHCSLHTAVVNTLTLGKLEFNELTPDPEGGVIGREADTNFPNGILEENAHIQASMKLMPAPKPEALAKMFMDGQDLYASYGITTVQDGGLNKQYAMLLKGMSDNGLLKLDVVGYQLVHSGDDVKKTIDEIHNMGEYVNRYKTGGIKVLLDGSPQAKTAWLSEPYMKVPTGLSQDYKGYPTIPNHDICTGIFEEVIKNDLQVLVHANGDAASEQYLDCYEAALTKTGNKNDLRPVMIHAQTVREDQLDRMDNINMIPSFFCMHTYFWGDLHKESLGEERAFRISPTASALRRDMPFTIHSDSPVLPPDTMLNIWTAVNRTSRSGVTIGADQRIDVMNALKAVTIYAAYQYNEESSKGSIAVGKRADLAILDQNPLDVKAVDLRNIKVMETIKDGSTIYIR